MKTVNVKYILNTKTNKAWEDFDCPVAVVDQNGALYLIVTGEVLEEGDDEDTAGYVNSYYIISVMDGRADTSGYISTREIIDTYSNNFDLDLKPVNIDLVINEYLEAE